LAVDKPPPIGIWGIMRVIACRRLLLALNVAALILAGMVAGGGAPTAAAAAGMSGMCAHCRAQPAPGHIPVKVPPCAIAECSAAMIVAPAPAQAAIPAWSRAEYFADPTSILSGEAPKADPPPPKSLLVL
jgi:hypothetical protein